MARISTIDPKAATGKAKELLDAVQAQMKMVPNLMRVLANSPAALDAYLSFNERLAHGTLDRKLRELIAVVVAETNACEYCLSAHTAIGKMVGLKEETILASRDFLSGNEKFDAALRFAASLASKRGQIDAGEVKELQAVGYTDGEIAEIITHVGLNNFTNYFNNAVATEVDFPRVEVRHAAHA